MKHVLNYYKVMLCLVLPFIENPFASDGLFNVPYSSETFGLVTLSTVAAFSGMVLSYIPITIKGTPAQIPEPS